MLKTYMQANYLSEKAFTLQWMLKFFGTYIVFS
jgi:hypothetical protein